MAAEKAPKPKDGRSRNLPNGGKGRPKGTPNKTTALAKDAIAQAASDLGGARRLVEWAQESAENERVFWQSIYTKLVPVQNEITGKDGGAIQMEQVVNDADAFTRSIAGLVARGSTTSGDGKTQH
jgi:hypothetical protein